MDPILSQENLKLTVKTPLEDDDVILDRFVGTEGLSQPFEFTLQLHSAQADLDFGQLLSQEVTVTLDLGDTKRYFSGIVGKIEQHQTITDESGNIRAYYGATLYPKFWLLKFSRDHRIFQNMSALDIITSILEENDVTNVDNQVTNAGQDPREYCVQYGESNFDFASRLMEEEGIFYFFTYDEDGHTLVLADNNQSATAIETEIGLSLLQTAQPLLNRITHFSYQMQVVPGQFMAADYNYSTPSTQLSPSSPGEGLGGIVYEYPGLFDSMDDGETITNHRIQELEWPQTLVNGKGTALELGSGRTFTLQDHPRDDFNQEYMLYGVKHIIHQKTSLSQNDGNFSYDNQSKPNLAKVYENEFSAFPAVTPFRAPRITKKRRIYSNQTAVVTGPEGEEIFCDEDGRIKVHFHWDLQNDLDENSSCWVRVAQSSAGSGWGTLVIPRIGMEVIVTFVEGDPDRPLVMGCVYNGDNKPADYPAESPTKTSFKSCSSPASAGGGDDDGDDGDDDSSSNATDSATSSNNAPSAAQGEIQAKITGKLGKMTDVADQLTSQEEEGDVEEDEEEEDDEEEEGSDDDSETLLTANGISGRGTGTLGGAGNQLKSILGYRGAKAIKGFNELRFEDLTGSEEFYMHAQKDMLVEIENSRTETIIAGDDDLTVKVGSKTLTIEGPDAGYTITIANGDLTVTVDGNISFECTGDMSFTAGASITMEAAEGISVTAGDGIAVEAGDDITVHTDADISVEAEAGISVTAGEGLTIETTDDIAVTSGAGITVDTTDDIAVTVGGGVTVDASDDIEINVTAGGLTIETSDDIEIKSGGDMSIDAGDIELSGSSVSIDASLDADVSAGLACSLSSGLSTDVAAGLMTAVDGGLMAEVGGGLMLSAAGGLMCKIESVMTKIGA